MEKNYSENVKKDYSEIIRMRAEHVFEVMEKRVSPQEMERIRDAFAMAGMKVEFSGDYPAWQPNPQSEIVALMKDVYRDLFGAENHVQVIHAGLECGLFLDKYPHLDMISFGPTLRDVHTPDERLHIPTVQMVWDHLLDIMKHL